MSAGSLSTRAERPTVSVGPRAHHVVAALIVRDWRITRSYRAALITDLAFGILNLTAYYYISRTLKPDLHSDLDGAPSYFAYAAVGVSLTVVLQAAVTGVSRRLREEQLTGTLEALLVQPLSSTELAAGLAGFPFLFAVLRALLYLMLAGLFLGLSFAHCSWIGLLASFLCSGVAFAGLGVLLAALVLVFKRGDAVGSLGTFALGLLGGALFPISVLPHWLRPISVVAPTRYAYSAVRAALFGHGSWSAPAGELLAIGAVTIAVALAVFGRALRLAVRHGTINQY